MTRISVFICFSIVQWTFALGAGHGGGAVVKHDCLTEAERNVISAAISVPE